MLNQTVSQDTAPIQWAYVVGAHEERLPTIKRRLLRDYINVAGHCDDKGDFSVPKIATFILLITDQVSHAVGDQARTYAKNTGMPLVGGNYHAWPVTRGRLFDAGIIPRAGPVPPIPPLEISTAVQSEWSGGYIAVPIDEAPVATPDATPPTEVPKEDAVPNKKPESHTHPNFVEARGKMHAARKKEQDKTVKLMVEFVKLRNGDISIAEMVYLFKLCEIPFPTKRWTEARTTAGFPFRASPHKESRQRWTELTNQWYDAIHATPEAQLPSGIKMPKIPTTKAVTPSKKVPEGVKVTVTDDFSSKLREIPTEALMAELQNRRQRAEAELKLLGKITE